MRIAVVAALLLCGCGHSRKADEAAVKQAGGIVTTTPTTNALTQSTATTKTPQTDGSVGIMGSSGTAIISSDWSGSAGSYSTSNCDSIASAQGGGWKSVSSAPRDGTTVEMLETYGVAPWYGIFHFSEGRWEKVGDRYSGVEEDGCLFWRPYGGAAGSYVDPTGGAQESVAYWCTYMHRPYNKEKDACE